MAGRLLVRYSGDPLENDDVLGALNIAGQPYTYIVATAALEARRADLAPKHQRKADTQPGESAEHLFFHRAMRLFMDRPVLGRTLEQLSLARAAQTVARDEAMRRQLEHDATVWREVMAKLAEEGIDLTAGDPVKIKALEERLVHPALAGVLKALQSTARLERKDMSTFEEAAYDFLTQEFQPGTEHVVMEGFTFLTPLQQLFVTVCVAKGATVHFLYPFQAGQDFGFQALQLTYSGPEFTGIVPVDVPTPLAAQGDLLNLQGALFSQNAPAPAAEERVLIRTYNHRHQEIRSTLGQVRDYLALRDAADRPVYQPRDIAIVMRNGGEFETLLLEEAERLGLAELLALPPRMLLLTPVGRFVLTLYQIWNNGLKMSADQFESILASGWLGSPLQDTTEQFNTVRAQMFDQCATAQDWAQNLQRLTAVQAVAAPANRLPSGAVSADTIGRWQQAVGDLSLICSRLFAAGQQPVGNHVQLLLDVLFQIAPTDLRQKERLILARIKEVFEQLAASGSLDISADEFGRLLAGLVQERLDEAPAAAAVPAGKVWVTTPEGVDGAGRKIMFYIGVDNQRVPRGSGVRWPFSGTAMAENQVRERYYFLAVVRAAREFLHLSYARTESDELFRPSAYLLEAARMLGRDVPKVAAAAPAAVGPEPGTTRLAGRARRSSYDLAEIAHAGLCLYRYMLERLDERARHYRSLFHVTYVAQAQWLDAICENLAAAGTSARGAVDLLQMFKGAMDATRPAMRAAFPGLRPLDWLTVESAVLRQIQWLSNQEWLQTYPVSVEPATAGEVVINDDDDRRITVKVPVRHALRVGRYLYAFLWDQLKEEWLAYGPKPAPGTQLLDENGRFTSQHQAVDWWRNASKLVYGVRVLGDNRKQAEYAALVAELAQRIQVIESGSYPKHAGDHCTYCPVKDDCLGS